MSSKNRLQEHFQKLKQTLPKYATVACNQQWQSTVTLPTNITYQGIPANTKVDAEQSAAEAALSCLQSSSDLLQRYELPLSAKHYIFIDIENVPHIVNTDLSYDNDTALLGFMSTNHHLNLEPKLSILKSKCHVTRIDSTERDATDHLLTFSLAQYCSSWIHNNPPESITIVTGDHYASILKVLVSTQLPNTHFIHQISL